MTGSNGKTTTVRLLAAMCVAHGWVTAQSGTDGVRVADAMLAEGDWAGPAGARLALRDVRTEAAVFETARGGMLRRGLAVAGARTAIVTNVQADHFGEYGVDDLQALAAVKLVLAKGLAADGILVLNGDDPVLRAAAADRSGRTAWFSLDADAPCIAAGRAGGAAVAWRASDGVLRLSADGTEWTLGAECDLPLAAGGIARFNVSNMLAASLGAWGMGIAPSTIAAVLATFGAARGDNPGRLMRWHMAGVTVLLDYAHNPDGLTALLAVAESLRGRNGRLLLLLGQAGNRDDDSIRALARAAAAAKPAVIALKELPDFLRGRARGEVPRLLDAALRNAGQAAASIVLHEDEAAAAQALAMQARAGDVVVLPVHGRAARTAVIDWLDARERSLPAP
ncbi:MAG: Mur ligase family protein [Gemmatimonadota bacterium]|nr:Mur ligase family protein [Gemmatimonadota bacterium]